MEYQNFINYMPVKLPTPNTVVFLRTFLHQSNAIVLDT